MPEKPSVLRLRPKYPSFTHAKAGQGLKRLPQSLECRYWNTYKRFSRDTNVSKRPWPPVLGHVDDPCRKAGHAKQRHGTFSTSASNDFCRQDNRAQSTIIRDTVPARNCHKTMHAFLDYRFRMNREITGLVRIFLPAFRSMNRSLHKP